MASADFTIADVLEWARTKPADERYNYGDGYGGCALCLFLREAGLSERPLVSPYLHHGDRTAGWWHEGESYAERRAYPIALETPLASSATFGELVSKLEALCPDTPVTPSNWLAIDTYMHDIEQVSA